MEKLTLLLLATILASGCTNRVYQSVPLVLPPDLVLPAVGGSMECLAPETYQTLVKRDQLQAERRATLRAIIETTHDDE